MRWNDKPRAYWIELVGGALYEFSPEIELVDFQDGEAKVKFLKGEYQEDLHIKLQDHIDSKTGGGVAIFFQEEAGNC